MYEGQKAKEARHRGGRILLPRLPTSPDASHHGHLEALSWALRVWPNHSRSRIDNGSYAAQQRGPTPSPGPASDCYSSCWKASVMKRDRCSQTVRA